MGKEFGDQQPQPFDVRKALQDMAIAVAAAPIASGLENRRRRELFAGVSEDDFTKRISIMYEEEIDDPARIMPELVPEFPRKKNH